MDWHENIHDQADSCCDDSFLRTQREENITFDHPLKGKNAGKTTDNSYFISFNSIDSYTILK